jgi:diguanylate cyclase (GGDEF)-like protein
VLLVSGQLKIALVVGCVVLLASLFGILTRPIGSLAAFWPANAILLGLMVRRPSLASPSGWIGAFGGYIVADLATGGEFGVTLWLTFANLAGALLGFLLFQLLPENDRRLHRPQSVLYLFAICAAAAMAAAVTGGGAARIIFGRNFFDGLEFWFVTELVNNLIILPAILTFPHVQANRLFKFDRRAKSPVPFWKIVPLGALLASAAIGVAVGGPGAIAFPVPALLWCAVTYNLFTTSVLTMAFCSWLLIAISAGIVGIHGTADAFAEISSIRLGVALLALGPLAVASINAARTELMQKLSHIANHDGLTGALTRSAFMERGAQLLDERGAVPASILMVDIDHFKRINDQFGHAVGDSVLIRVSHTIAETLRSEDLFGRLGGEEFAVLLCGCAAPQAKIAAERIRLEVEALTSAEGDGTSVTVSLGIATTGPDRSSKLDSLLHKADQALYRAKEQGRNGVVVA